MKLAIATAIHSCAVESLAHHRRSSLCSIGVFCTSLVMLTRQCLLHPPARTSQKPKHQTSTPRRSLSSAVHCQYLVVGRQIEAVDNDMQAHWRHDTQPWECPFPATSRLRCLAQVHLMNSIKISNQLLAGGRTPISRGIAFILEENVPSDPKQAATSLPLLSLIVTLIFGWQY